MRYNIWTIHNVHLIYLLPDNINVDYNAFHLNFITSPFLLIIGSHIGRQFVIRQVNI